MKNEIKLKDTIRRESIAKCKVCITKSKEVSQVWRLTAVIPALWEAEAGGSLKNTEMTDLTKKPPLSSTEGVKGRESLLGFHPDFSKLECSGVIMAHCSLDLSDSSSLLTSAYQEDGTIGVCHHTRVRILIPFSTGSHKAIRSAGHKGTNTQTGLHQTKKLLHSKGNKQKTEKTACGLR
ncbi:hypothetical protein AAY473_018744 [Plecturocebus cupreus]